MTIDKLSDNETLRLKAEEMMGQRRDGLEEADLGNVKSILHELRVHQVELEMQNNELRRIQDQLEKSNLRFSRLFDSAPIGYFTLDRSAIMLHFNHTFIDMIQPLGHHLLNRPFTDLLAPEDKDAFLARYRSFFRQPSGKTMETRMIRGDGSCFYASLEGRLEPMDESDPGQAGQPVMLMVLTDITDRKKVEEKLRYNAKINAAMVELAEALLSGATIEDTSFLIWKEARELTGSPYGFVGYVDRYTGRLVTPNFSREVWAECSSAGQPIEFEDLKGLCGWVLNNGSPLLTNDPDQDARSWNAPMGRIPIQRFLSVPVTIEGQVVGIIALCNSQNDYDEESLSLVTRLASLFGLLIQRMRTEEDLRGAKEAAESANIAKSNFLATMSHEIRTPMNAILGFTELTLESDTNPRHRENLEIVMSSARHLLNLLNDILDLSKIEAGKMEMKKRGFDLQDALRRVFKILSARARAKGIHFEYQLVPNQPLTLIGDDYRLCQVLFNLIGNAIKFTQKGSVIVEAMVEQNGGDMVETHFVVRDTGIGIPSDKTRAIFDPFTQVDSSSTRQYGGTGLGLAISQKLVQAMDGKIWVESELKKGSEFHFIIPFRSPGSPMALGDDGEHSEKQHHSEIGVCHSPPVVLLVEDNPVNQKLVTVLLKKKGCEVLPVDNGHQAIGLYKEREIDLILMDIEMPGMNGMDTTKSIREMEASGGGHVPIVAMTAHAMRGDRDRFLAVGMDDYISKPIDAAVLYGIIDRYSAKGVRNAPNRGKGM